MSSLINLPIGSIIAWENTAIPSGWAVCDGLSGTPDLRDKFVRGASVDGDIRVTGGATTHSHTNPNTNSRAAHNHGGSKAASASGGGSQWVTSGTGASASSTGHTHSVSIPVSDANLHSHTIGASGSASSIPKHIKRVFIRRQS